MMRAVPQGVGKYSSGALASASISPIAETLGHPDRSQAPQELSSCLPDKRYDNPTAFILAATRCSGDFFQIFPIISLQAQSVAYTLGVVNRSKERESRVCV